METMLRTTRITFSALCCAGSQACGRSVTWVWQRRPEMGSNCLLAHRVRPAPSAVSFMLAARLIWASLKTGRRTAKQVATLARLPPDGNSSPYIK